MVSHRWSPFVSSPPPDPTRIRAVGRQLFRTVDREFSQHRLELVSGAVPRALEGTLWRVGPGRFERGGTSYAHPFDGDGMVTRFAFGRRGVTYTNRFVRTREFVDEERRGAVLYRGFGTNKPGGAFANALRVRFKNAANTGLLHHAGRLFALWEGGLPHELSPTTLETLRREDFGGVLANRSSTFDRLVNPELPFAAHPKTDPETGEVYNFGLVFGLVPRLNVYRLDTEGDLHIARTVKLSKLHFCHDFMMTRDWWVFVMPETHFDIAATVTGRLSPAQSMRAAPNKPMRILLVPRNGGEVRWFDTLPGFAFHTIHAWQDGRGAVHLDVLHQQAFPDLTDPDALLLGSNASDYMAFPTRITLRPEGSKAAFARRLSETPGEFPALAPWQKAGHPTDVLWTASMPADRGAILYSCLRRLDLRDGSERSREFFPGVPNEPTLVRDGDGTAWILSIVYYPDAPSELLVLHPTTLETQARLRLPHALAMDFHGLWRPVVRASTPLLRAA